MKLKRADKGYRGTEHECGTGHGDKAGSAMTRALRVRAICSSR